MPCSSTSSAIGPIDFASLLTSAAPRREHRIQDAAAARSRRVASNGTAVNTCSVAAEAPGRVRGWFSRGRLQTAVVLVAVVVAGALIVSRLPRPVAAVGMLDQCLWGWPVVHFEGEDWKQAIPDNLRAYPPAYVPIAEWPSGLRFDKSAGALFNSAGDRLFRKGDRVRIEGSVIEVHGDPSPCFYTLGVKVEAIASP